ncbi:MAG: HNH endonuclease signature motif containing protein [Aggregatilineales bacterium]
MLNRKSRSSSGKSAIALSWASIGLAVALLLTSGCSGGTVSVSFGGPDTPNGGGNSNNGSSGGSNGPAPQFGVQQKTSGCRPANGLPDSACTPGAIIADATTSQICQSGYSSSVRNVPTSEKNQVYAEYGISHHATGEFEVDHLVSLELGGSNDISNLWPEAALPKPGFHEKDKVENYLHAQVCSGAISLQEAQREIATNWLAVYQRMGGG